MPLNEQEEFELLSLERERASKGKSTISQQIANDPISQSIKEMQQPQGMLESAGRWFYGDPNASIPERIAANPITRFAMGAAFPILGGAQLLEKGVTSLANPLIKGLGGTPLSEPTNDRLVQLENMKKAGGMEGTDVSGIIGSVASPAALGAAKLLGAAPTAASRIGQGAAMGALGGATAPVTDSDYWSTKAAQTAGGAAAGAVIPAAWEGAKAVGRGVRNVVQPYMGQWGADQAAGRLANLTAGPRKDAVIAELRGAQSMVPGSNPTAGQAAVPANSAEFSALQKMASDRAGSEYFGPAGIEGAQNQARIQALRTVGQTPKDLESAVQSRNAAAKVNYGAAGKQNIESDAVLNTLLQRPSMDKVLSRAADLAQEKGQTFQFGKNVPEQTVASKILNEQGQPAFQSVIPAQSAKYPVDSLHYMKMAMDDLIKNPERFGIGASEAKAIGETQKQFVQWIGEKSKPYDFARTQYAAASKPINQMEVGQEIENRLVPALSEDAKQRAASYAQALRDAPGTIKRATGQPRFESLDQIMNPQQMQTLGNVQKDLARNATFEELAAKGMPEARKLIGEAIPDMQPTGFFSIPISFARGLYNRVTGHATDKVMKDLATRMQDPQKMAEIMQNANPYERQSLVDALMKYQGMGAGTAVSQGVQ